MKWREKQIGKSGVPPPRRLTDEEIEYIVSEVPDPNCPDPVARSVSRSNIIEDIVAQFEITEWAVDDILLTKLKEAIKNRFVIACVKLGDGVGLFVADALGATATQITLDTFKLIGISSIGKGIDGYKNLLYLPIERSDPSMTIHFLMEVTRQDVIEMRAVLEAVTINTFVKMWDIGVFHRHDRLLTPEIQARIFHPDEVIRLETQWWHQYYDVINSLNPSQYPSHVMRLYLDTQLMYEHRVTMPMIANALLSEPYKATSTTPLIKFDVITSPFETGVLDIVPREEVSKVDKVPYPARTYLFNIIRPALERIQVKGITGITKLAPITIDLTMTLEKNFHPISRREMEKFASVIQGYDRNQIYVLPLNRKLINSRSIPMSRILDSLKLTGIQILQEVESRAKTRVTKNLQDFGIFLPLDRERDIERLILLFPEPPVKGPLMWLQDQWNIRNFKAEYTYAVTVGSNLNEVIRQPWVDTFRTVTNDLHKTSSFFGVESARTYFIYELLEILATIARLSARNLTLLADFIFSRGMPLSIKFSGESKRGRRGITKGTNEKFKDSVFAAGNVPGGTKESRFSMAVARLTGSHVPVGAFSLDNLDILTEISNELTLDRLYRFFPEKFNENNLKQPLINPVEPESMTPAQLIASITGVNLEYVDGRNSIIGKISYEEKIQWIDYDPNILTAEIVPALEYKRPSFLSPLRERYTFVVLNRYSKLNDDEKQAKVDEFSGLKTKFNRGLYTYSIFNPRDLDYSQFRNILFGAEFEEISSQISHYYVDLAYLGGTQNPIPSYIKNKLTGRARENLLKWKPKDNLETRPLLWHERKVVLRVYFLVGSGPNVPNGYIHKVFPTYRMWIAESSFVEGTKDPKITKASVESTSQELYFPENLELPIGSDYTLKSLTKKIRMNVEEAIDVILGKIKGEFQSYPESQNGYEVFACDFEVSDKIEDFAVYPINITDELILGPVGVDKRTNYDPENGPWSQLHIDFSRQYFAWQHEVIIDPTFNLKKSGTQFVSIKTTKSRIDAKELETKTLPIETRIPIIVSSEVVIKPKPPPIDVADWIMELPKEKLLTSYNLNPPDYTMTDYEILTAYLRDFEASRTLKR